EPGDLVFFDRLRHNGIYIGDGRFIHARQTGRGVNVARLDDGWYASHWSGARRLELAADAGWVQGAEPKDQPGSCISCRTLPSGSANVATHPPQSSRAGARVKTTPARLNRSWTARISPTVRLIMIRRGSRLAPRTLSCTPTLRRTPLQSKLMKSDLAERGVRPSVSG